MLRRPKTYICSAADAKYTCNITTPNNLGTRLGRRAGNFAFVVVNRDFHEMIAAPAGKKPVHAKHMERTLRDMHRMAILAQIGINEWATITPSCFVLTLKLLRNLGGQFTHLSKNN